MGLGEGDECRGGRDKGAGIVFCWGGWSMISFKHLLLHGDSLPWKTIVWEHCSTIAWLDSQANCFPVLVPSKIELNFFVECGSKNVCLGCVWGGAVMRMGRG